MRTTIIIFVMAITCFISCTHEEKISYPQMTSDEVIARFRTYFYKDGKINANKLENFSASEWAVATEDGASPCEIFTDITGIKTSLNEKYEYSYISTDGKCSLRITGNAQADKNAIYAILYVQISASPELRKVYIATKEFFNGTNEYGALNGVPVIFIQSLQPSR